MPIPYGTPPNFSPSLVSTGISDMWVRYVFGSLTSDMYVNISSARSFPTICDSTSTYTPHRFKIIFASLRYKTAFSREITISHANGVGISHLFFIGNSRSCQR